MCSYPRSYNVSPIQRYIYIPMYDGSYRKSEGFHQLGSLNDHIFIDITLETR